MAPDTGSPPTETSARTVDDRSTAFRAVEGGGETVNGGKLLIAAYAFVWLLVVLFVVRIYRRQTAAERRLATVEKAVNSALTSEAKSADAPPPRARSVASPSA